MQPLSANSYKDTPLYRLCPTSDSKIQDILVRSWHDTEYWCTVVLGESFDRPMTHQHKTAWKLMDDDTLPKVATCGWRGIGKTTGFFGKAVKGLVMRQIPFLLYAGSEHDYSADQTEAIKTEILSNEFIRECFGQLQAKTYEGQRLSFSKKSWYLCDPNTGEPFAFVLPKGALQKMRGANVHINHRRQRPTYLVVDDLEDDEQVLNEERRDKLMKWFDSAFLNCVPQDRPSSWDNKWHMPVDSVTPPPWRVFYMDTLKHQDSLMANIMQRTDWRTVVLPKAIHKKEEGKDVYYSAVPELFSDDTIRAEIAQAKANRNLDGYYREMMCLPMASEDAVWNREDLKHYSEEEWRVEDIDNLARFIIIDPARTSKPHSAHTAMLACAAGWMPPINDNAVLLRALVSERMHHTEVFDKLFAMVQATNTNVIAIETTGMSDAEKFLYQTEAALRKVEVTWLWLDTGGLPQGDFGGGKDAAKRARASLIIPYYNRGWVWHEESLRDSPLEIAQMSYPYCALWDALDTTGHIPKVLTKIGVAFQARIEEENALAKHVLRSSKSLGRLMHKRIQRPPARAGCRTPY